MLIPYVGHDADFRRFTKRVVSSDEGLYSTVLELQAIDAEIDAIEQQLPAELKWTKANLQQRIYSPNLSGFIMLHTWRMQCKCDLHRLTVSGTRDCVSDTALQNTPFDYAHNLRLKCVAYATELSKIWADVLDLGLAKPVHDPAIAGCAHQCAKILTLVPVQDGSAVPGEGTRISAVIVCQMILDPLKDIYPKAKLLVSHLQRSQRLNSDNLKYEDVCRMRSQFEGIQPRAFPDAMQTSDMGRGDMAMAMQTTNEEQVRSLLNHFRG